MSDSPRPLIKTHVPIQIKRHEVREEQERLDDVTRWSLLHLQRMKSARNGRGRNHQNIVPNVPSEMTDFLGPLRPSASAAGLR
jgi:hypothetical protein